MSIYINEGQIAYLTLYVRDNSTALVNADPGTVTFSLSDPQGVLLPGFPSIDWVLLTEGTYRIEVAGLLAAHYVVTWTAQLDGLDMQIPPEDLFVRTLQPAPATNASVIGDLTLMRGEARTWQFEITREDGEGVAQPMDLSSAVVQFTVKRRLSDADDDAVILKTTADGVSVFDPVTGIVLVSVVPEDTADLPFFTQVFHYDMVVREVSGNEVVAIQGRLTLATRVSDPA